MWEHWASLHVPYTAVSRKVVEKSARDNLERYCGWFLVHCFSKKFQRIAQEAMDVCFRGLKESNKRRFDSFSVKNKYILPFGIVPWTAFATTFLEIAIYVCHYVFVDIFSLSLSLNFIVCHYFTCHF